MLTRTPSLVPIGLACCLWAAGGYGHEDWPAEAESPDTSRVNEGTLHFLSGPPDGCVHHHQSILVIRPQSLRDGWVEVSQCHEHLDAVPATQIVFREGRTRRLAVTSASGMHPPRLEGASVQIEAVRPGARLCLRADMKLLSANQDGTFSLRNGPFMRRFLDGYYPLRVSADVQVGVPGLRLISVSPARQPGFKVWERDGHVYFDAWFEGRLFTELRFGPARSPGHGAETQP